MEGSAPVFERFTSEARRVLVLAQEEARVLNHDFIGTEHILLGLIHLGDGPAEEVLTSFGISLQSVREKVTETIGAGHSTSSSPPPFTPRAKKVLELSLREALQLGHNYIGPEHLLLGLIREGDGVACQVLESLGADLPGVRQKGIEVLKSDAAEEDDDSAFPEGAPFCSKCGQSLERNFRFRELIAKGEGDRGRETTRVAFCGNCGVVISATQLIVTGGGLSGVGRTTGGRRIRTTEVDDPEDPTTPEGEFQLRCKELVAETLAAGFIPGGLIPAFDQVAMINRWGAVRAAQHILGRDHPLPVTRWLVAHERPDLTIEWEVLQPRWSELFIDEERVAATRHLRELGATGFDDD